LPSDIDLLFGQIAIGKGFCTKDAIDRCLALQGAGPDRIPVGRILVNEGLLTEEQHSKILALQREKMRARDSITKRRKEATLFGKLVLRERYLSEAEVNECLRLQAAEGEKHSLGEIMVEKGYLTPDQVKAILAKQEKKIMNCRTCRLSFTVLSMSQNKKIDCPRCMGPLQDGKPSDSTRTDGEFSTKILTAAAAEGSHPEKSPAALPKARRARVSCRICGIPFEGILDSTSRIRCPSCHTAFTIK